MPEPATRKGEVAYGATPVSQMGNAPVEDEETKDTKGGEETKGGEKGDEKKKADQEEMVSKKELDEKNKYAERLGNELGETRKQLDRAIGIIETLQANASEKKGKQAEAEGDALGVALADLEKIDFEDADAGKNVASILQKAIDASSKATADKLNSIYEQKIGQALTEKDQKSVRESFLNSDEGKRMEQRRSQGLLDQALASSPHPSLEDDFSLNLRIDNQELSAKNQALEAENARLKKIAEAAGGDDNTGAVITKTGGDLGRPTNVKKRLTGKALDESMLAKVRAVNG